ncbi:uncharacterized protein LOC133735908 [Rosa rugosa]|uniref:uncharacterized protein LOC133735908 n=1 Tax=Rosa rugosa TaxID=74645 RepID=UPI002B409913|nr:uncharacterized protein LOC133735908 [Rosa rugosa]
MFARLEVGLRRILSRWVKAGKMIEISVITGDLLLRSEPRVHRRFNPQLPTENLVDRDDGGRGAGSEPASQRQALLEREGEVDGADAEHLHDLNGGDPGAVPDGVLAQLLGVVVAGDLGNGDLSGEDLGIDGEGDEVAEAVDGASDEVKAGAEVGDGGRAEGLDGGGVKVPKQERK